MRIALVVIALSVSACGPKSIGAGTVEGGSTLVPPMPAHVTSFQKWEHMCFGGFRDLEEASSRIAEAGQQGWEMVAIGQDTLCFKRPLPQSSAAAPQPSAPALQPSAPTQPSAPAPQPTTPAPTAPSAGR